MRATQGVLVSLGLMLLVLAGGAVLLLRQGSQGHPRGSSGDGLQAAESNGATAASAAQEFDPEFELTAKQLAAHLASGSTGRHLLLFDERGAGPYEASHIAEALPFPGEELERALFERNAFPDLESMIVVVGEGVQEAERKAILDLVRRARAAGHRATFGLAGGMGAWRAAGLPVVGTGLDLAAVVNGKPDSAPYMESAALKGARPSPPGAPIAGSKAASPEFLAHVEELTPEQLKAEIEKGGDFLLVYVGLEALYRAEHIPGARYVPQAKVVETFRNEPKDRRFIFCCGCCAGNGPGLSGMAAYSMYLEGFKNVSHLKGHLAAWKAAGFPVEACR